MKQKKRDAENKSHCLAEAACPGRKEVERHLLQRRHRRSQNLNGLRLGARRGQIDPCVYKKTKKNVHRYQVSYEIKNFIKKISCLAGLNPRLEERGGDQTCQNPPALGEER